VKVKKVGIKGNTVGNQKEICFGTWELNHLNLIIQRVI